MFGKGTAELAEDAFSQSLDRLFDPETGRYYAPYNPTAEAEHEKRVRARGSTGEGMVIAVLDTGVLSHHPGLKGRLVDSADFTGEGPEDYNGHGTAVALLAAGPNRPGPSILNVKVLDRNGRGEHRRRHEMGSEQWCQRAQHELVYLPRLRRHLCSLSGSHPNTQGTKSSDLRRCWE